MVLGALVAAAGLSASPASAAVAVFGTSALSDAAHQVRILWQPDGVTVDVQVVVDVAEAGPVALVLAVPDALEAQTGDSALFAALDAATRPVVRMPGTPGSGCDGETTLGDPIEAPADTSAEGAASVTDLEVELLALPNVKALVETLLADGLVVPEGTSTLLSDEYVNGLGYDIVVARAEAPAGRVIIGPLRVAIRRPADGRVAVTLPLAASVEDALVPVTVWTQGGGRYHVENTASVELETVAAAIHDQLVASSEADYLAAMDGLTEASGGLLFVAEFAADLSLSGTDAAADGASYVSRLHARAPAALLKDARVALAKDGPDLPTEVEIPPLPVSSEAAAWLLLFGVATLGLRRRAHGRPAA